MPGEARSYGERNRFARSLDQLRADERELAEAAVHAARGTFAQFTDKPGSAYYDAPGLTARQAWERVVEELARVSVLAGLDGEHDVELTVPDIELMHRGIFEPVFGPGARFRQGSERVDYPIYLGAVEAPVLQSKHGMSPRGIERGLERALRRFEDGLAHLAAREREGTLRLHDAVDVAIRLYVAVIRVHPFMDGNGRTAWVAFSYALRRCGLPLAIIPPTMETRWALGLALRADSRQDSRNLSIS